MKRPVVTVLTATLPERAAMLDENIASITNQTCPPYTHLIKQDGMRKGGAFTYNRLLDYVITDWFCCLDDDDIADPHHLETMMAGVEHDGESYDVVYTGCRSTGGREYTAYNQEWDLERFLSPGWSIVPITALCRTALARKVGGFPDTWDYDRAFWRELYIHGAKFRYIPEITWDYRFHGRNQSLGQLREEA